MDFVVNYYFDFKNYVFSEGNFGQLMEGFWFTIKLSSCPGFSRWHGGSSLPSCARPAAGQRRRFAG